MIPLVEANGARIPAIGLGTSKIMGEACVAAVAHALRAGYRYIDTAAMYANEEAVGEGIRRSGVPREEVFLLTKVDRPALADADFERSTKASLSRLKLDYVDLLLIHWPNPKVPLAETVGALGRMKTLGLTRHVGVANFPVAMLEEAVKLSAEPLVANQCEYHPYLDQAKLLAACRRLGVALLAYSPLRQSGPGSPLEDPVVLAVAAAHGVTPAQAILRWHVQQTNVVAIPKSSTPHRISQNMDVFGFSLSDREMAAISALHRPGGRRLSPPHAPQWD